MAEDTRFKEGKQWWRQRTTHGRDKLFLLPEVLLDACVEYFESIDNRKWNKVDYKGKDATRVIIPMEVPYTQVSLCLFLDISEDTWRNYSTNETHSDFFEVTRAVNAIIYTQKFEGAAVGAFSHNIIARDLGLVDKIENNNKRTLTIKADEKQKDALEDLMKGPDETPSKDDSTE